MFGFGFQQKYVDFLENCFKNYASIKNYNDFKKLFPEKKEFTVLKEGNLNGCNFVVAEWQLVHKRFRIIYLDDNGNALISFLIPYNSYSEWVEAEFRTTKGEFSGERGQLNPMINLNAKMQFITETNVGYPVVMLGNSSMNGINNQNIVELINVYFANPEL
jgi:hypothetical protein